MSKLRGAQIVLFVLLAFCAQFPAILNAEDRVPGAPDFDALGSSVAPADAAVAVRSAPTPARNPYNARLADLAARISTATPAEAAVLLAKAYDLREFVDDPAAVARLFEGVAQVEDANRHPLVRDEALHYLALIDVHNRNLPAAAAKFERLGTVRTWAVMGPFPAFAGWDAPCGCSSFAPCIPALTWVKPDQSGQSFPDRAPDHVDDKCSWHPAPAGSAQPWQDLSVLYPHAGNTVVFAATALYSDRPQRIALRFSADSALALAVNGRQIFIERKALGIAFDQHAIAVELRAGWNTVLLKLEHQAETPWRFTMRTTALPGGGLPLRASTELQPENFVPVSASASVALQPPAADLIDLARQAATANPSSASALETLGELEHERARGDDLDHLEAAAQRFPTATRWLAVADYCGDSACTFAAVNAALRSDPDSEPADLALANYYFGRGQLEKARALLQQALAREPGDFAARNLLADLYMAVGLNAEALRLSEQLEREFPHPLWLQRKLATRYLDLGLLDRAQALLAAGLRASFDDAQQRALLLRVYERRRDVAALRSTYQDMLRLDPADTGAMAELAALDTGAGNYASAEQRLRSALAIASNDEDLHGRLANLLELAGRRDSARQELARALAINPTEEKTRQRLELTSGSEPADMEAPYLADPAALAASAQRTPPPGAANAVKLAAVRVERVFDTGLSSVREQQVYYITNQLGARQFSERTVQYAPGSQQLRILHARVYKRDGRIFDADEGAESAVGESTISMYYDVRSRVVQYPAVEPGDVVELDYRIAPITNGNPYGDYFGELVMFRSNLPVQLQRFVLITPAGRRFNVVERQLAPAQVTLESSQRIYRWETHNQASLPSEPKGPPLTEVAPYVHVSTFASWDEVGRWYAQLIQPQFALDASLREQAARLLKNTRSELDQISAIHQFVLRNTHYVAMEFGVYSYKPYPVAQVYARRFGDCKDKASLIIALLRQAGIDAEIALVRTRRLGQVQPQATSVALFDHAIVYVPKYDLWLDGTAEYAGLHELPLADQGAMALTVAEDGQAQLRRIPVTTAGENYTRRTVHARVLSDGRIQFEGVAYTRGEDAPGLRRDYETPERQRDAVRNSLAEVFPAIKVDSVRVDGAHDLEHPITVEFRGALDVFAGTSAVPLTASWMPRAYVEQLAPLTSRAEDLLLPAPWTTEEELHFALPAGAVIPSLPADAKLDTPFGTATLQYRSNGRELVVHTSVQFRQVRITPAEYPQFRRFCEQVERAFRNNVIKVALRE